MKQLVKILDSIQKGEAEHFKGLQSISKLYKRNPSKFKEEFIPIIQRLLVTTQNDSSVDRVITFISKFTSKQDENGSFIDFLLGYLIDTTQVLDKTVRLRSCQLISSVLITLPSDAEISDDIWERLAKRMIPRLRDKLPTIRIEAVKALARLQDPLNVEDDVILGYVKLLAADSNKDVRKIVLKNLAPSLVTLPHIIKRTRDNSHEVRSLVYKILAEVPAKQLDIDQRITVLRNGLGDGEPNVKNACVTMICNGWLKGQGDDPVKLLNFLLVEKFEDLAEKIIKLILRNCDISWTPPKLKRNALPPLSAESALLWRVYLVWLKKRLPKEPDVQQLLDRSAPAIPEFCLLLKAYISNEVIARQLVGMVEYLDLSDEAGRRELSHVLREFLPAPRIAETLKKNIMKTLKLLHADEDTYINMILEIISEIQDPLEASSQVPQEEIDTKRRRSSSFVRGSSTFNLRSSSINLRASTADSPPIRRAGTASVLQNPNDGHDDEWLSYSASNKLADLRALRVGLTKKKDQYGVYRIDKEIAILEEKSEDDKLTSEERRWVHCMAITEDLLQLTTKDLQNPGIHDLLSNVILRYVTHTAPRIRERAMRCLGLFCMLSKDVARTYLYLFSKALQNDLLQIQCVVLKLLFDLLLVYGMDGFEEIESSQKPHGQQTEADNSSEIVNILGGCLLHESAEMRAIVVEGFCKLMFGDQISDHKILSKLIVLFFLNEPSDQIVEQQDKKPRSNDDSLVLAKNSTPYAHIRQCLSVFLPAYSFHSLEHMHCVLEAFIPTIREVAYNMGQYSHGPDDDVQVVTITRVAQLFIHLTTTNTSEGISCPHNELAIKLAKEIICDPKDHDYLKLCRMFKDLQLSKHPASIKTLKFFIETLIEKVKESTVSKSLVKYFEELQKLDPAPEVEPTPTALANLREELNFHATERQEYIDSRKIVLQKRRLRRSQDSVESDSEDDEDENQHIPASASKRQVPARQSRKAAEQKISLNMKSLKQALTHIEETSEEDKEEDEEDEEESKGGGSSTAKRGSGEHSRGKRRGKMNRGDHAENKEDAEEGEEDAREESDSPRGASRRKVDSDDEMSSQNNTSSNVRKRSTRSKQTHKYTTDKGSDESDSDGGDDESDYEDSTKKSPQKSPQKTPPKTGRRSLPLKEDEATTKSEASDDSDNSMANARKAKRTKIRDVEIKPVHKRKRDLKKGGKETSADSDRASSDLEVVTKRLRTTSKGKKGGAVGNESNSNSDGDENEKSEGEEEPPSRPKSVKSKAPARRSTTKEKKAISDDEVEESEDVETAAPKNSTRSSKGQTRGSPRSSPSEKRQTRSQAQEKSESEEEEELHDSCEVDKSRSGENSNSHQNGRRQLESNDESSDHSTSAETARNTRHNAMIPSFSQTQRVVVAFGDDMSKAEASKLTALLKQVNGTVYTGTSLYSSEITHVTEKKDPTTKMLFAIVSNRWLVSPEWIKDSAAHGAFLNENDYGVKCKNPIHGKKIHLDASIINDDKRRVQLIKSIIKVGKGSTVDTAGEADIVIISSDVQVSGKGKKKGGKEENVYKWDEFVCYLRENR